MDSAHDDEVSAWPSDAVAAAGTEPLSPADSASELPDMSSGWHKAATPLRLPNGQQSNHAHRSDAEICSASSSPRQPHNWACDTATTSQHTVTQTAARARRRARAVQSAVRSAGAVAEALRSHPLSDLDAEDALDSCSSAPQMAPRPTRPALPSSQLSSAELSRDSEVGRSSAATTDIAAEHWVIPDACTGDSSSHPQCNLQQNTAVQSLSHDGGSGDCPRSVAAVLGDNHLLAFAALIGEAGSAAALTSRGGRGAVGDSPGCLYGASADPTGSWQLIVQVCHRMPSYLRLPP